MLEQLEGGITRTELAGDMVLGNVADSQRSQLGSQKPIVEGTTITICPLMCCAFICFLFQCFFILSIPLCIQSGIMLDRLNKTTVPKRKKDDLDLALPVSENNDRLEAIN